MDNLEREIASRLAFGCELLSVAALVVRYAALGYRVNRDDDCRAPSRIMTGPRAGESYPACTTGINETDTGLRAWNIAARRDSNFHAMTGLRESAFAVTRGAILSV
jgi:hypothetical protein